MADEMKPLRPVCPKCDSARTILRKFGRPETNGRVWFVCEMCGLETGKYPSVSAAYREWMKGENK